MNVFKTDRFCVTVPHGWKAFKVNDRIVQICKGGVLSGDVLRMPYMQLNFSGDSYMLSPSRSGYYNVTDIPPHRLGKYVWQGFECESMGFRVAMLWTGEGKRQFQVSANLETPLGKISMSDADVLDILASVCECNGTEMGVIPPHIATGPRVAMEITADISPRDKNGCKACGAAFADPSAKFCQNCGAERDKK